MEMEIILHFVFQNHPVQLTGATFGRVITKHREKLLQVLRDGPTEWEGSADVPQITSTSVTESGEVIL